MNFVRKTHLKIKSTNKEKQNNLSFIILIMIIMTEILMNLC